MSISLWKDHAPGQFRDFIVAQDAKFQCAMRKELVELTIERGVKLSRRAVARLVSPRPRSPRDILIIRSTPPVEAPINIAQTIIREVCEKHGFTKAELISPRRAIPLVAARHEAMYRMSKETTMSLPAIGRRLGGRDHTTIIHGIRKYAAQLEAGVQ